MVKIAKGGEGKTLYIELSIYPGTSDSTKNLTISCPDKETQFKTSLSDNGLKEFRKSILKFYKEHVLDKK